MDLDVAAAVVSGVVGLGGGLLVPRVIARVPEPVPDPDEDSEQYPAMVPFAELAARPRLALRCAVVCALAAAATGAVVGWGWGLTWLLFLVPAGCVLAVIDFVTWYLPSRVVWASAAVVALLELVTAIALGDVSVLVRAAIGAAGLGAYYGLLWFISPRIMAFGDLRLGVLIGLALGPFGVGTVILSTLAAGLLLLAGLLPMRLAGKMIGRHLPFGPFLVGGALVAVIAGQVLTSTLS